jgi:hypothetical protein
MPLSVYLTKKLMRWWPCRYWLLLVAFVSFFLSLSLCSSLSLLNYAGKQLNQPKGLFSHALLTLENTSVSTGEYSDWVIKLKYVYLSVCCTTSTKFNRNSCCCSSSGNTHTGIKTSIFLLGQSHQYILFFDWIQTLLVERSPTYAY